MKLFYMMNYVAFLLLTASCSSLSDRSNSGERLDNIENSDFLPGKEVIFKEELDKFQASDEMNLLADSLVDESIYRIPEVDLKILVNEEDPLSEIASLCYQKKNKRAELVMNKIYKRYQNHPGYWNQVGTCYFLEGHLRKALLYYNKSRSLSKKYAPPINNLGVIYQRQGFEQKALLAFKKARGLNSFSLTPVFNLAQMYLKYGFSKRARSLFLTLFRKSPQDVDVLNGLATSYLLDHNIFKSVEFFSKIPSRFRKHAGIALNYAIALKYIGRPKDAKQLIENLSVKDLGSYAKYYQKVITFVEER